MRPQTPGAILRSRVSLIDGPTWQSSDRVKRSYSSLAMSTVFGSSDLAVSRMGLGLAALGRPGYINLGHASDLAGRTEKASLEELAHSVLDAAYERWVRYFDVARSYGLAEAFLASWLKRHGLGPADVTVGSKWGYTYVADWQTDAAVNEVKDLSAETLRRQLRESEELLGEHLRLYQIHSATLESGVLDDSAVLNDLNRLRASGVAIGLTVTGPTQGETSNRALEVGGFDTVQATWNLLEQGAGSALMAARDAGLGVIIKEALANGRLTIRGDVPELAAAASRAGCPPDVLALAVVLAQPWVDVVLSGAASVNEVESNLAALALGLRAELTDQLLVATRQDSFDYWQTRATLPWN
jgi:aryl-alcohol dehydrogenase-like predicted oxidoreductase